MKYIKKDENFDLNDFLYSSKIDIIYIKNYYKKWQYQNLQDNMWAITTSSTRKNIEILQPENRDLQIEYVSITDTIISNITILDCSESRYINDILKNRTSQDILCYGYADINIKRLFFEAKLYLQKGDKVSMYLYNLKIEEILLHILNYKLNNDTIATKTHKILLENYNHKITIKEIANILNVSESTILSKYKAQYNKTPKDSIYEIRMNQAKALQNKNPTITIKELAKTVGCTNAHRFKKDYENFFK